jgi:cytochrome c556
MAERQAFNSIAQTLHQQAGELADSARAGDLAAMNRVRDEINATCNACHQRFRDVSGPM